MREYGEAWQFVLTHYNYKEWESWRSLVRQSGKSFPDALQAFLVEHGYLSPQSRLLQNFPDGVYGFRKVNELTSEDGTEVSDISFYYVFHKQGRQASGLFFQDSTDWIECFRGNLQGRSLLNPIYAGRELGDSRPTFVQGRTESFQEFQQIGWGELAARFNEPRRFIAECFGIFP